MVAWQNFNSRTPCEVRLVDLESGVLIAHFNSRTPCEVRQWQNRRTEWFAAFQLTHPVWGATCNVRIRSWRLWISTHAPHVRCDNVAILLVNYSLLFQLTHPVWGATYGGIMGKMGYGYFNSRTPCEVRRNPYHKFQLHFHISTHAPRVRCDIV